MSDNEVDGRALTAEEKAQQKRRNMSIALGVVAFVLIVFAVTILRLGASVAQ